MEYAIGAVVGIGMFFVLVKIKKPSAKNYGDVTKLYIQEKKLNEAISNKKGKLF